MTSNSKFAVGVLLAALAGAVASSAAHAQAYPNKPIRLLVGYAAGGPVDVGARQVGAVMQKDLGQSIVVDNRPGAGGAIAGEAIAHATPDGYTLLFAASPTQTTTPHLLGKMSYDPRRDYTPISLMVIGPNVLIVRSDSTIKSVAELVAWAKANPGKASFGSAGIGASNHLAGELLAKRSGAQLLHVPYKGNSQAMTGVLGGETTFQFAGTTDVTGPIRGGRARGLAVTAAERLKVLPDVPTMAEAGFPDFSVSVWHGLEGPPGLPQPIVARLYAAARAALRSPELQKFYGESGFEIIDASGEVLGARVNAEYEQWGDLIKGLKLNQQ